MVIRWKVVRSNRRSFVISEKSSYSLLYKKGTIVKEVKKGLGIMCFETERQAKVFVKRSFDLNYKILKVRAIGRGRKVKNVAYIFKNMKIERSIKDFFDKLYHSSRRAPNGTICYDSIEVLT